MLHAFPITEAGATALGAAAQAEGAVAGGETMPGPQKEFQEGDETLSWETEAALEFGEKSLGKTASEWAVDQAKYATVCIVMDAIKNGHEVQCSEEERQANDDRELAMRLARQGEIELLRRKIYSCSQSNQGS